MECGQGAAFEQVLHAQVEFHEHVRGEVIAFLLEHLLPEGRRVHAMREPVSLSEVGMREMGAEEHSLPGIHVTLLFVLWRSCVSDADLP